MGGSKWIRIGGRPPKETRGWLGRAKQAPCGWLSRGGPKEAPGGGLGRRPKQPATLSRRCCTEQTLCEEQRMKERNEHILELGNNNNNRTNFL